MTRKVPYRCHIMPVTAMRGRIIATEAHARGVPPSEEPMNIEEQEASLLGELEKEAENPQEPPAYLICLRTLISCI